MTTSNKSALSVVILGAIALLGSGCGESSGKVRTLQTELEHSRTQLATANAKIATLQSQLTNANAKIAELTPLADKARILPIRITSRRAGTDTNTVYQIVNLSGSALAVKIKLSNTKYQYSKSLTCVLPATRPAPAYEIGPTEGWPAAPGDVLEMTSEGYDVMTKTF